MVTLQLTDEQAEVLRMFLKGRIQGVMATARQMGYESDAHFAGDLLEVIADALPNEVGVEVPGDELNPFEEDQPEVEAQAPMAVDPIQDLPAAFASDPEPEAPTDPDHPGEPPKTPGEDGSAAKGLTEPKNPLDDILNGMELKDPPPPPEPKPAGRAKSGSGARQGAATSKDLKG